MGRWSWLLCIALSAPGVAGDALSARDAVLAAEAQLTAAWDRHDVEAVRAMLAPGFQYWSHRGQRRGVEDLLALVRRAGDGSTRMEDPVVRVHGDVAILTAHMVDHYTDDAGQPASARSFVTDVFVRVDGRWLLAGLHETVLDDDGSAAPATATTRIPGACDAPAAGRTAETGCYLVASVPLGPLPPEAAYWHLYRHPTAAAARAEAARVPQSTATHSLGQHWVNTIAAQDWQPASGERVAVLGPLTLSSGTDYTARYMEAVFPPGMQTSVHRHAGAEAWYVLSGAQCLETPDGVVVARAGEGAVVPEGPPMALSGIGTDMRRSVLLVLHDSSRPWMTVAGDWSPQGRCPPR